MLRQISIEEACCDLLSMLLDCFEAVLAQPDNNTTIKAEGKINVFMCVVYA
jgi:hypothetical protein